MDVNKIKIQPRTGLKVGDAALGAELMILLRVLEGCFYIDISLMGVSIWAYLWRLVWSGGTTNTDMSVFMGTQPE